MTSKIKITFKGKLWGSHQCEFCTKSFVHARSLQRHVAYKHAAKRTFERLEKDVTQELHSRIGGILEVRCRHGIIDLETDDHVIEVKRIREWKHALGQALIYAITKNKAPWIHTFGHIQDSRLKEITEILGEFGIKHTHQQNA